MSKNKFKLIFSQSFTITSYSLTLGEHLVIGPSVIVQDKV